MNDRVQDAVDGILDRVASGRFAADEALPHEADLAAELGVSRLTMREAVKVLRDRGVLAVMRGRGTYLAPRHEWRDLSTLVSMTLRTASARYTGLKLVELRRMIEVGASGLAARNRTDEDLASIESHLDAMRKAHVDDDVETVAREDLAFHRAIMRASANPFVLAIMMSLESTLREARFVTSSSPDVRIRALRHHGEILRAIRACDEAGAKEAMRFHMTQTRLDFADAIPADDCPADGAADAAASARRIRGEDEPLRDPEDSADGQTLRTRREGEASKEAGR